MKGDNNAQISIYCIGIFISFFQAENYWKGSMNKKYSGLAECNHVRQENGMSLLECKVACERFKRRNGQKCNAFNYAASTEKCSMKSCSDPVPEPNAEGHGDNRGYYMIGIINLISFDVNRLGF